MHAPATAHDLFAAYEAVRAHWPTCPVAAGWQRLPDLAALAPQFDAFCLDAFGVLNIGQTPIAGARERLAALQRLGKPVLVVSNAAAVPSAQIVERYQAMGFALPAQQWLTSRDVMVQAMTRWPMRRWGVVAPAGTDVSDLPAGPLVLNDAHADWDAVEGFVLLSALEGDAATRQRLRDALRRHARPVLVPNADLASPHESGFRLEPGALAHWLQQEAGIEPQWFGKPFAPIFAAALQRLGLEAAPQRVLMVGDTLHTDVLGGRCAGMATALVVGQGASAGLPWTTAIARSGIVPDYVIDRI
ncbi:MAG: HAD hydrolase-like protein [Pseudomonadota bacterium]